MAKQKSGVKYKQSVRKGKSESGKYQQSLKNQYDKVPVINPWPRANTKIIRNGLVEM